MKIAVIGAGAIGSLVAGYLKIKGAQVTLVGHPQAVSAIKACGLAISGVRGDFLQQIEIAARLTYAPDLVILATKTQDIAAALEGSEHLLQKCLFLTTQNGIQADEIVSKYIPRENIVSSIVMFGATNLEPGKVVHNFEGSWIIGSFFNAQISEKIIALSSVLDQAFPVIVSPEMPGMKYLKIFTNANNCLPAILGKSMQETFSDLEVSRISVAIWKEGFEITRLSGINLVSLPGFPLEKVTQLISLPSIEAAQIFSKVMQNLSQAPLYGSILQSIMRGKVSEIDYINGEFVRLAQKNHLPCPLNHILIELVHQVERTKCYCSKEDLLAQTKELI